MLARHPRIVSTYFSAASAAHFTIFEAIRTRRLYPRLSGRFVDTVIRQPLREAGKEELEALVELHGGNKSLAAKALGISRRALYRKLKG